MKIRNIMTPEHPTDPNDESSFKKELEENIKCLRSLGVDVADIDIASLDAYNIEATSTKEKT